MNATKILLSIILTGQLFFISCGESSSNKQVKEENITQNEMPKLCDCKNYWLKDVEDAMYNGRTEPSDFVKECGKFYTVEELTYADCGLTKYDPNFKAK